jgi:phosphatidylglycerophosphatase A
MIAMVTAKYVLDTKAIRIDEAIGTIIREGIPTPHRSLRGSGGVTVYRFILSIYSYANNNY